MGEEGWEVVTAAAAEEVAMEEDSAAGWEEARVGETAVETEGGWGVGLEVATVGEMVVVMAV
jgi:hypothetical protein